MRRPPVALTIAGSDPSGGAGIQADLKTFSALGAYGTSVLTALTAQSTRRVTGVEPVPVDFVAQQLDTLLADVRVDAVKVGMLGSADAARCVAGYLREAPLRHTHRVLDPVMVATSGSRLLDADAVDQVRQMLPHVDVVTPNLPEAAVLLDTDAADDLTTMRKQATALRELGAPAVLLKGGHLGADQDAVDLLADDQGVHELRSPRIATTSTHGTGCTLSSALAALRPQHDDWLSTARAAKAWLTEALRHAEVLDIGAGHGPVHHFHELDRWR